MLHYAFCKESHIEEDFICCSFICDDGLSFRIKTNYDSILKRKIKAGQFFVVKTNKEHDTHLRERINNAPYSKKIMRMLLITLRLEICLKQET
ncbi:MAG: hypothetical protein J5511_04740 [Bacilli bacterium]|nr:hypothetical protein [Bacilli bacterium]